MLTMQTPGVYQSEAVLKNPTFLPRPQPRDIIILGIFERPLDEFSIFVTIEILCTDNQMIQMLQ